MAFSLYVFFSIAVYHVYVCLIDPKNEETGLVFYSFSVSRMVKFYQLDKIKNF